MQPQPVIPAKLRRGDTVRVVAPAQSRAMVTEHDHTDLIDARFESLGLRLTYGAHVDERDDFESSSIASRVADLHEAFGDPDVQAVLTVIGGFNSQRAAAAPGLGPDRCSPEGLLRLLRHHRAAERDPRPHRSGHLLRSALVDLRNA